MCFYTQPTIRIQCVDDKVAYADGNCEGPFTKNNEISSAMTNRMNGIG